MLAGKLLGDLAQLFQAPVVGREAAGPEHTEQRQHGERGGIHGALAPVDAAHFLLVEPGQVGLGEDHPAEQVVDEACTARAEGRQRAAGQAEVAADAGGQRVELLVELRRAGQVEAAQLAGALVAVAGEGQFDEQAQALADLAELVREVEDATTALGVALLVHAQDHLAVETAQQFLELLAHHGHVAGVLLLAEAGAEHLLALLARQLVEELVEAQHLVGLAQHQVDRHVGAQALMDLVQALAGLAGQGFQLHFAAALQLLDRNAHQHAVERARATLAQQAEQGAPGAAVDLRVGLGQVAPGGVDQHGVIGEVPVGIAGAGDVLGQALAVAAVEREVQAGEVQQAGLAAALRAEQQVPGQVVAPLLAAPAVQAGALEGAQGVLEAVAQLILLLADLLLAAQALLRLGVVLLGLLAFGGAPAGEHHGQAPEQEQQADGQQTAGGRLPELMVVDRQQRADEPHQQGEDQHQQQAPDPGLAEKGAQFGEEALHFTSSMLTPEAGSSC